MVILYRNLLALRRKRAALTSGPIDAVTTSGSVLSFRRQADGESLTIVANNGHTPITAFAAAGEIILSTHGDRAGEAVSGALDLRGDEAVILSAGST